MVTLDSTFLSSITASKGKQVAEAKPAKELPYLNTTDLTFLKRNARVTVVEADNKKNSWGYTFLIYSDHGDRKQSKAVVEARDKEGWFTWFELQHNSETGRPYQGKRVPEVDQYDNDPDKPLREHQSDTDDDLNKEEQRDSAAIWQSPIHTPPTLQVPFKYTTMSQTTMAPTIAVQTTTAGTSYNPSWSIKHTWNKGMKRNPGGGGPGGNPSGGGGRGQPPSPQGPAAAPQQVPQPQGDIRMMGALPEPFTGERAKAGHFIEAMKTYVCLNWRVPGFESAMQKINLALTLMHGEKVAGWVKNVGAALDELNPDTDNIDELWTTFLEEFAQQYTDTQVAEWARVALESLRMKAPEIDEYISKFEELCNKAGYTMGNTEVTYLFLKGLSKPILEDVIKGPQVGSYEDLKDCAIQVTRSQELLHNILKQQGGQTGQTTRPQFIPRSFNNRGFRSSPHPDYSGYRRNNYRPNYQRNNGNPNANRPFNQGGNPQYNSSNLPRSWNNCPVPMDIGRARYLQNRGQGSFAPIQGQSTDIQAMNMQTTRPRRVPGNDAPCFKCGSTEHWARKCPMAQANLIDFNETMAYNEPLENTSNTQITTEQLKQTLYNLSPQQHAKLANTMGQQEEDFPNV